MSGIRNTAMRYHFAPTLHWMMGWRSFLIPSLRENIPDRMYAANNPKPQEMIMVSAREVDTPTIALPTIAFWRSKTIMSAVMRGPIETDRAPNTASLLRTGISERAGSVTAETIIAESTGPKAVMLNVVPSSNARRNDTQAIMDPEKNASIHH